MTEDNVLKTFGGRIEDEKISNFLTEINVNQRGKIIINNKLKYILCLTIYGQYILVDVENYFDDIDISDGIIINELENGSKPTESIISGTLKCMQNCTYSVLFSCDGNMCQLTREFISSGDPSFKFYGKNEELFGNMEINIPYIIVKLNELLENPFETVKLSGLTFWKILTSFYHDSKKSFDSFYGKYEEIFGLLQNFVLKKNNKFDDLFEKLSKNKELLENQNLEKMKIKTLSVQNHSIIIETTKLLKMMLVFKKLFRNLLEIKDNLKEINQIL
jgi:hypothetical protein